MRFVHPEILTGLLALPVLALVGWWMVRRRRRALVRFAGGVEQVERLSGPLSPHRRGLRRLLVFVALAASLLALARPQWGTGLEPVTRRGIDVVLVLDNSLSMAAEDLVPSRLLHARHSIATLVEQLPGNRLALVTFAGQAQTLCPLTLDHSAISLFLDTVDPEQTQVPGTALAEALQVAVDVFASTGAEDERRSRAIVLLSDGEDHEGGVEEVISRLDEAEIPIFAIGTGTTRGAPIPLRDRGGSLAGYKKDREERVVTTRLDEAVLELLALDTGGRYYRATPTELEVQEIAEALGGLDAREYGSVLRTRYEERFQWPLLLAALALLAEAWIGDRRSSGARRKRDAEEGGAA